MATLIGVPLSCTVPAGSSVGTHSTRRDAFIISDSGGRERERPEGALDALTQPPTTVVCEMEEAQLEQIHVAKKVGGGVARFAPILLCPVGAY